jgi:hypothetical protein
VQVKHQPRDESDGHARGHIQKLIQVCCTHHSPTSKCGQISPGDILPSCQSLANLIVRCGCVLTEPH